MEEATAAAPEEIALVERLWRSGSSAVAISPSTRQDHRLLTLLLTTDDRSPAIPMLRRHRVATWRFAAAMTLDNHRADEAVEATWRRMLVDDPGDLGKWTNPRARLFAETRAIARQGEPIDGVDIDLDTDADVPFDPTGDIALLGASFCLLDEPARTAVWLHAVEEFDDADIAYVLGILPLEAHRLVEGAMHELRSAALRGMRTTSRQRCAKAVELFEPYLDLSIEDHEEEALLAHLSRCRRCSARVDALEAPGLSLIDRVMAPPAALTSRLRALAAHG